MNTTLHNVRSHADVLREVRELAARTELEKLSSFTTEDAIYLSIAWLMKWQTDEYVSYHAINARVRPILEGTNQDEVFIELMLDTKIPLARLRKQLVGNSQELPKAMIFAVGDVLVSCLTLGLIADEDYRALREPWDTFRELQDTTGHE